METDEKAKQICRAILPRINEALQKKDWNDAYELAFCTGLVYDIKEVLEKVEESNNGRKNDCLIEYLDKVQEQVDIIFKSNDEIAKLKQLLTPQTQSLNISTKEEKMEKKNDD